MFDCAYQPEPEPKPAAIPQRAARGTVWLVATVLVLAIAVAALLGSVASDYVLN